MKQKQVSLKVAKAIKNVGYPQNGEWWFSPKGIKVYSASSLEPLGHLSAPTYIDVWLWLWREKKIAVEADYSLANNYWINGGICGTSYDDPEECIIEAIDYLVDNNFIKK